MSIAQSERVAAPEPGSDRAVVAAVRAGQVGQYALLYERYRAEALRIARRQVGPDEAQDLVQETFARVLRAIQNGGGPTEDVAGYLFRTLRNLRVDRGGKREFATDDVESVGPAGLWVVPDTTEEVLDRGLVADAFAELPPRWREVLWLTEVEGIGPSELSDRMGIKPTAVSTLSLRARAGFRSAWLQAHVRAGSAPTECKKVVSKLGDYQTGRLSTRRRAQVQEHLDHCDHCPAVVAELATVSDHMGVLLLPVVLLAPKALWWLFGGWGVKAGFLLWGTKAAVNRLHDPKVAISSVGGVATVAVVTAVAMAMAAPEPPPAADPSPSASAPAANSSTATTPGVSPPSSGAADGDPDSQARTDETGQAADSPASVPVPPPGPADQPAAMDQPAPERSGPTPGDPEPSDAAASDPETSTPPALSLTGGQSQGSLTQDALTLSGDGAVPGATITATDDDGRVVADGTVESDGAWTVEIQRPGSGADAGAASGGTSGPAGAGSKGIAARGLAAAVAERTVGATVEDGDGPGEEVYYTVTQTVGAGVSDRFVGQSAPLRVGPYTWVDDAPEVPDQPDPPDQPDVPDPPEIACPADGAEVELWGDGILIGYQADDQYEPQWLLDGAVVDPNRGGVPGTDWLACDWSAPDLQFVLLSGVEEGMHHLTLQYVDERGEEIGEATSVSFTAVGPPGDGAEECEHPSDGPDCNANNSGDSPGRGNGQDTSYGEDATNGQDASNEREGLVAAPADPES